MNKLFRVIILRASGLKFVERFVRRSRLFRKLVTRFIAGDDLDQALPVAEDLVARGFLVTLDFLGESTHTREEAQKAVDTYKEMLRRIAASPAAPKTNISIKLTQCGLDIDPAIAESNYRDVLQLAADLGNFVRIDMESSAYVERTMEMMGRVRKEFSNTGTVLQTYLYRTPEDVEKTIEWQMRIRLVKGAYLEPASVALPDKKDVDDAFVKLGKRMMEASNLPAYATHDEKIIQELCDYAREKGIAQERFEFQMLHGIRRDLQERLRAEGYQVRVYVPFGDSWYPYFTRRLAERPANLLVIIKAMFKG